MPVEQREQVTHVRIESTGNRRNSLSCWKAAAFSGWHEPDESRGSRPDLWAARGEIPRAYPAYHAEWYPYRDRFDCWPTSAFS
jgi:hypothetical protein